MKNNFSNISMQSDFIYDNRSNFLRMIDRNIAHFSLWCITSSPLIAGNNKELLSTR